MKITFIIALTIATMTLYAQPSQEQVDITKAEMTYWKLRARLVGDEQNLNRFSGFNHQSETLK